MTAAGSSEFVEDLKRQLAGGSAEKAIAQLEAVQTADLDERKAVVGAVRTLAEDEPRLAGRLAPALAGFLRDEKRSVRLRTAKGLGTIADGAPEAVLPAISALKARLADDDELYFVRARAAEALGYVGLEKPEAVSDPELLAEFRLGLSFDEPELKEKLAKGLECIALGDPGRFSHLVESVAEHLDDNAVLVRYHLTTVLLAVGCDTPESLTDADAALERRLADDNPYVRGRAAEALGVLARDTAAEFPASTLEGLLDDDSEFVRRRVQFALEAVDDATETDSFDRIGSIDAVRDGSADIVAEITAPDADTVCPQCGHGRVDAGPPICPRCGVPF